MLEGIITPLRLGKSFVRLGICEIFETILILMAHTADINRLPHLILIVMLQGCPVMTLCAQTPEDPIVTLD